MEYPLFLEQRKIGTITGSENGKQIDWTASCPLEEGWIYRVYLGREDEPKAGYLGIMMPEDRKFVLRKSLAKSKCPAAADRGIVIRHRPGEPEPEVIAASQPGPDLKPLPFPVSALEPVPDRESFVCQRFRACSGKYAAWEGRQYFLVPGQPGEELAAAAFFCLLRWIPWEDSGWWVLCTDTDDQPFVLPE